MKFVAHEPMISNFTVCSGGEALAQDRLNLPSVDGVRCPTGSAVITGPNKYGNIKTPYIIHAVGPNYWGLGEYYEVDAAIEEGNKLLRSAYTMSLDLAAKHKIEQVAFSLLSAGLFRGPLPLEAILDLTVETIQAWARKSTVRKMEVTLCAFSEEECQKLQEACFERLRPL
jgi:O-acetyl-ADP-ribose deacetylase (regulator of RNase III)